jgi:hypothetical protein
MIGRETRAVGGFLGLTVAAARNHRVEHTYPMSKTLDVLVGRSIQIGGHYEVWGDVETAE